jgi:hypothetical protein
MQCPKRPGAKEDELGKIKGLCRPALFDHRHHAARADGLRGSREEKYLGNRCGRP